MKALSRLALGLFRRCLALCPPRFRQEYSEELGLVFRLGLQDAERHGLSGLARFCARELRDAPGALLYVYARERNKPYQLARIRVSERRRLMVTLSLQIEVSGCPTTCLHCWARGHAYSPMPVADIAWVLEGVRRFCDQAGAIFGAYPMHEVLHHPQAAEVLKLFKTYAPDESFEPIPTDGVALARRDDWQSLLEAAWYRKALASGVDRKEWTFPLPTDLVELVVRPDLSAYRGIAGIYGTSYGNLRSDPIATVLGRAMADGETTDSLPLYFSAPSIPPPAEAAQKVGNPGGQKLYFHAADVYTRWLDLALEAYRRY